MNEVSLEKDVLADPRPKNVFEYLRALASTDELLNEKTDRPVLEERYDGVGAVASSTMLSCYLSGDVPGSQQNDPATLIYPFGLNASQKTAVERAFSDSSAWCRGLLERGKPRRSSISSPITLCRVALRPSYRTTCQLWRMLRTSLAETMWVSFALC